MMTDWHQRSCPVRCCFVRILCIALVLEGIIVIVTLSRKERINHVLRVLFATE